MHCNGALHRSFTRSHLSGSLCPPLPSVAPPVPQSPAAPRPALAPWEVRSLGTKTEANPQTFARQR